MKRNDPAGYFKILGLSPEAKQDEILEAYTHLKNLYSSDSPALAALGQDLSEEDRRNNLLLVEEAYRNLASLFETDASPGFPEEPQDVQSLDILGDKPSRQSYIQDVFREMGSSLRAHKLRKTYNQRVVVKDVNIEVRPGEIIALLGRNGAGKTTTFQMIVGLVKPESGGIFHDGKDISGDSTHQRAEKGITYLPQENSVFLKTSVENNLLMVLELMHHRKKKRRQIAHRLLEELELLPLAKQSAHSLSGGERRKLEICRSMIINPKFLLLDEPFTGIDPLTIVELQKILVRLKFKGIGIILSDHNVRDTLKITDRAYIIDDGDILVVGSPKEIVQDERAKVRFLGRNFKLGEEREAPLT